MSRRLTFLQTKSSVVVDAPLREVWKVCRAWGRQPWMPLLPDGTPFDVHVEEGASETEIGAIRCSKMGKDCQIFEKLVGIDDEHHTIKWKLVDHKDTVSPFEQASFVNFQTTLSLTPVTMSNQTFVEWEGSCYTEPEYASSMQDTLNVWYAGGMSSLKTYAAHQMAKKRQANQMHSQSHNGNSRSSWVQGRSQQDYIRDSQAYGRSSGRGYQHQQHRPTY